MQTFGAYITYFVVLNDFGFPMHILPGLGLKYGNHHAPTDIYNPYAPNLGNTMSS